MRALRLKSTAVAILLLGAGAVSAQGMKTNETSGASAAQQNDPAEKVATAGKSDQSEVPEFDNKQQTTDKGAPAGAVAKGSSEANGSADVKSKRTSRHVGAPICGSPPWTVI
jgi:hypothetical protein